MPLPIALEFVHGTWAFLTFLVVFFFAISHGYYSRSGSAINQRPYHDPSGDAPGAHIPSTLGRDVDRRDYSRGTR
jgi:hypothetical protein